MSVPLPRRLLKACCRKIFHCILPTGLSNRKCRATLEQHEPSVSFSGDSSVNLFVHDSLRQSGARFCHLHSQLAHQGLECNY